MRTQRLALTGLIGFLYLNACTNNDKGDTDDPGSTGVGGIPGMTNVGSNVAGGMASTVGGSAAMNSTAGGMTAMAGMSNAGAPMTKRFKLRIENTSSMAALPTPFAPGSYAVVSGEARPYASDGLASMGLESATEDGNPSTLAAEIPLLQGVANAGVFDMPLGATAKGPIQPGDAFEFTFVATPGERLDFESMFGQSNEIYATTPSGIELFDSAGNPSMGDVTKSVALWDSGTERKEAPGMGPNQAPRQGTPNTGPREAGVVPRSDGTRAIPIPAAMLDVQVTTTGDAYAITLINTSDHGPLISPLSPAFYALHASSYRYFIEGSAASAGLERLAEEGNSALLVTEATAAGAMADTAGSAAYGPGASVTFTARPTAATPLLTIAMMVGQSNDAFIGTRPGGVSLLDASGTLRMPDDIRRDLLNSLATWDAGTEDNETPGVGRNQAPRQPAPNTGAADPNPMVRLYADSANDLAQLAERVMVTVVMGSNNEFDITLGNTSDTSKFPFVLSPVAWAVHGAGFMSFAVGAPAAPGLEALAEDGKTDLLLTEWASNPLVLDQGVAGTAPFASGGSVSFHVAPDSNHRYLSIASMLVPSNDTFAALEPTGVTLLDASGAPRAESDIANDIMMNLRAWDAGTEANQGGALGPDMAPHQKAPNTGASEGSGRVRAYDGVWPYPPIERLLKVTLMPM